MKNFPKDFLFGGAISACQAEGAWNEDGRTLTIPDIVKKIDPSQRATFSQATITRKDVEEGKTGPVSDYPKRWGIDFDHTYKEDIRLMAEMGHRCFRFSIAMSRVYPHLLDEKPNEKALAYYDDVIKTIRDYGMEPLVTIAHFDPPIEIVDRFGGWDNREMIDIYFKYAKTLIDRYHDQVTYWLPFNEINAAVLAPFKGVAVLNDAPEYENKCWNAAHNQFVAAAKTVKYAHDNYPSLQMGSMVAYVFSYAYSCDPKDVWANDEFDKMSNLVFLDVLAKGEYPFYAYEYFKKHNVTLNLKDEDVQILKDGTVDWVGYSYYQSIVTAYTTEGKSVVGGNLKGGVKNPNLVATPWGWQIDPLGLRILCNRMYDRYNKPLFILENGIGMIETLGEDETVHDDYRIAYLRDHLKALKEAINDGCDIRGYTWWGPMDVVSSGTSEMSKRYGFVYVDQDDEGKGSHKRYLKDSYHYYKHLIETDGEEL